MYWLVAFMTLNVFALVAVGLYLQVRPAGARAVPSPWVKKGVGGNLLLFVAAEAALLVLGVRDALAQAVPAAAAAHDVSVGFGLAMIGVALPTGLAAIAAALAVGPIGSASLAVIAEKPESFGRTLIYLGLAEGIAIYGLVVSILMLEKI
jgi:V/A-type H+-transporting ATPase subunit K